VEEADLRWISLVSGCNVRSSGNAADVVLHRAVGSHTLCCFI